MDLILEQLQYDLHDLAEAVHMMMLNLNSAHGVGCLCVIESQLEKIIGKIKEGELRMEREEKK